MGAKPVFEDIRVDVSEVGGELEIPLIEVGE